MGSGFAFPRVLELTSQTRNTLSDHFVLATVEEKCPLENFVRQTPIPSEVYVVGFLSMVPKDDTSVQGLGFSLG